MVRRTSDHRFFTFLVLAIVSLAWLELFLWSLSPYAKYLDHELLAHVPVGLDGPYLGLLLLFVLGWLLMTVAMMLPTSLPLIALFHRLTRARRDRTKLLLLLLAGYLGIWTLFGGLAHIGDLAVHAAVHRLAWLEAHAWLVGAATLLLAGLYQFSSLKYACLDACRSPLGFISAHWRGRRAGLESLGLGLSHGLFCLGCCWHLMLLMFAFACGNLGWMLALGAVMAAEKNLPWGRQLSAPLGIFLIATSTALTISGLTLE